MPKRIDLTGQTFNRWNVESFSHTTPRGEILWNVTCVCGVKKKLRTRDIRTGRTKSCGCLAKELTGDRFRKHGLTETPTHISWMQMHARCTNPSNSNYKDYGGRGIKVCARWKKFENFYSDMGERPKGTTLDRKDNDKGYFPSNCRWATATQQVRNRRISLHFVFKGELLPLFEIAKLAGIKYKTLHYRITTAKWFLNRAFTERTHANGRKKSVLL